MAIRGQWNLSQDGIAGPVRSNVCNIVIGAVDLVAGTADEPLAAEGLGNVPTGTVAFTSRASDGAGAIGIVKGVVQDDGLGDRVLRVTSNEPTDTGRINWLLVLP